MRESNIMKICKGMDVTPFELFQTDKKVLVINDPKEIKVILECDIFRKNTEKGCLLDKKIIKM